MPYSLRVDGRTTYIVGYAYTQTGTQEPTVGNDWYPVNLDEFDNQDYASVDAYIASENGQDTLQGCGVSALVPLATAIQRLADNGINITVHEKKGLYMRNSGGAYGLIVDKNGQAVYFTSQGSRYVQRYNTSGTGDFIPTVESDVTVATLVNSYGLGIELSQAPGQGVTYNIDGITYSVEERQDGMFLNPNPPAWK